MLDAVLAAAETDGGLALSLRIENAGSEPVTLDFRTGQRAEFTAHPTDEEATGFEGAQTDPVWRYGADRMFAQALGSETIEPGEAVGYEATWRDPPSGTYRIVGKTASTDRSVRAETVVAVK